MNGYDGRAGGNSCCEWRSGLAGAGQAAAWAAMASLLGCWGVAHMCGAFFWLLQGEKVETNARFLSTAQW
jgi:hypothetical protein